MKIDYLANQRRFLPVLVDAMFSHWRSVLEAQGKSRDDFAASMQARCRIGSQCSRRVRRYKLVPR